MAGPAPGPTPQLLPLKTKMRTLPGAGGSSLCPAGQNSGSQRATPSWVVGISACGSQWEHGHRTAGAGGVLLKRFLKEKAWFYSDFVTFSDVVI